MTIRNQSWYDRNESRPYPISDEATAIADDGVRLSSRMLADLHIAYPQSLAQRAYISAVSVTETLATITILGTDSAGSPASYVPLAAITLPKPFDAFRMYPLSPLMPGVGGWLVFGREAARASANMEMFFARFSTPVQSVIHPSCTRPYRDLPITSFSKSGNSAALTGLITLSAGNDLEIVKECREVPPVPGTGCDPNITTALDVIVVRLRDTVLAGPGTFVAPAGSIPPGTDVVNVFNRYAGPCAGRPESTTCGEPQPIEMLASVLPDCNGNIDLLLRGCAVPSRITEEAFIIADVVQSTVDTCGVVVDCGLGLGEACITPDRLPDATGRLPNEYDDLCESLTSVSISLVVDPADPAFVVVEESQSKAAEEAPTLPFCTNFASGSPDLVVANGVFNYVITSDSRQVWSTEGISGEAFRNVSLWDFTWDTFYKRAFTRVQILAGTSGALHNAALVVRYHAAGTGFSYYVAEIDWDGHYHGYKLFRIGRFNGTNWNTEFSVAVPDLALNERYDLYMSVFEEPTLADAAWLQARLVGVDNPSIDITIGPLLERNYTPASGKFGMGTNRSPARFHHFCLENTGDITNGAPITEP